MNQQTMQVGIVGLGYVGLPLALLFVEKGFQVLGIDIDSKKIESLHQGKSYLTDLSDKDIEILMQSGRFEPTDQFHQIRRLDAVILCVPTPLRGHKNPDLSYLQSAANSIAPYLKQGQLIVLESSTYPGTTEEVLVPILEKHGYQAGSDVFVGYSPERIDPGNADYALEQIPKVVSGVTSACLEKVKDLYGRVFRTLVPVSSTRAAEMTKLLENAQRLINISFINEIARICAEMKIDIWEVIEAASTKPYGFVPYYPGPGVGGHCIPVDPLYLQWKAMQYQTKSDFIDLAKRINDEMPNYVIERTKQLLQGKKLEESKILLVGLTYKKDVNDIRESTQTAIFEKLLQMGAEVSYHDPLVEKIEIGDKEHTSVPLTEAALPEYDCVVILTDHSSIPYDLLVDHAPLIFDTRNCIKGKFAHVARL